MSEIFPRALPNPMKTEKSFSGARTETTPFSNVKLVSLDELANKVQAIEESKQSQVDLNVALDVLGRASDAMDLMYSRSQKLEALLKRAIEQSKTDLAAAEGRIKDWEARARKCETQIQAYEARLRETEHRAEMAERNAELADRNAAEAADWLKRYYDKILESFGSRTQISLPAAAA
ncbi:MAG: hypothetical protein JOY94_14835 [Methylobacteriaceae bacterium]|nr:hypothetical protein [Methylobacteriaceae bacterium]